MAEKSRIVDSLLNDSVVTMKGDYPYIITPLLDGFPSMRPMVLCDAAELVAAYINDYPIDKVVTMEAMGIPLATAVSIRTGVPLSIIRKRKYGLPGEVEVDYKTGYSEGKLYLNGFKVGEEVVIVDNVYSTGGTMRAVMKALDAIGVDVVGAIVLADKADEQNERPAEMERLVKLKVRGERVCVE